MKKEIDYKKKYHQSITALWIMLLITSIFYWDIHLTYKKLNNDIINLALEQQAEIYINAGWMPPFSRLEKGDINEKKE